MKLRGYGKTDGQLRPTSIWAPMTSHYYQTAQSSRHCPAIVSKILITINIEMSTIDGPRLTYINFMKVDWARYAEACDEYLTEAGETRSVEQAEKIFRKAVNKAIGLFIPAGRIKHFQQILPASAKSLDDKRDRKCPLITANKTLMDLNMQIKKLVVEDMRTKSQPSNWHVASMAAC